MELGPLIKYYRTQRGMTQKQLSNGICSIPHLSKIENNSKDANQGTITLLLERLEISYKEVEEKEELIKVLLRELSEKINFYIKESIDETFEKLKEVEQIIHFSKYLYLYELYKYRYLLFKGNFLEAEGQRNHLIKQKKNFSQHEEYLFLYYNAVSLIMKGQYKAADEILESLYNESNHESPTGDFLYHWALVKSSLEESGHAVYFGKMALQSFMDQHNFTRILHTLMLLGINYTHSKIYEEAQACFEHLIRNAELLKETRLLPQIYHNMGHLQNKKGNRPKALHYFEKSLALQSQESLHYFVTLYSIGEIHMANGEFEKAKQCFQTVNSLTKESGGKKYKLLTEFHLLRMESPDKAIKYLETKVIAYLEEINQHKDNLVDYYKMLSDYYSQKEKYQKAVKYLNKMI